MNRLTIKHNELTAEEFILLWETVSGEGPAPEQTRLAMEHTLFRVSVFDGDRIVAMARVIGDMGLDYYIKDVVVRPEYQGRGIGRMLIGEILQFINDHGVEGTDIFVELCAMRSLDSAPMRRSVSESSTALKKDRNGIIREA